MGRVFIAAAVAALVAITLYKFIYGLTASMPELQGFSDKIVKISVALLAVMLVAVPFGIVMIGFIFL